MLFQRFPGTMFQIISYSKAIMRHSNDIIMIVISWKMTMNIRSNVRK